MPSHLGRTAGEGRAQLALLQDFGYSTGAHLHPWVNPPHVEEVNARNSYVGFLPEAVERDKLAAWADTAVDWERRVSSPGLAHYRCYTRFGRRAEGLLQRVRDLPARAQDCDG